MAATTCPHCKQPIVIVYRRICEKCGHYIGRHDKWFFAESGKPSHRHCDNPKSYLPRSEEKR